MAYFVKGLWGRHLVGRCGVCVVERSPILETAAVMEKSFRGEVGGRIVLRGGGKEILQEGTEEAELGVTCCVERWTQGLFIFCKVLWFEGC